MKTTLKSKPHKNDDELQDSGNLINEDFPKEGEDPIEEADFRNENGTR